MFLASPNRGTLTEKIKLDFSDKALGVFNNICRKCSAMTHRKGTGVSCTAANFIMGCVGKAYSCVMCMHKRTPIFSICMLRE